MTHEVFAFAPDTSIETAARLLATRHIGGAPVVDSQSQPLGVVTLADLVDPDRTRSERDGYPLFYRITDGHTREIGDDVNVGAGRVVDVMSPFVLSIAKSATLVDAANRMIAETVHRLLVMDDTRLAGIVSSIDLLRGFVMKET